MKVRIANKWFLPWQNIDRALEKMEDTACLLLQNLTLADIVEDKIGIVGLCIGPVRDRFALVIVSTYPVSIV